MQTKSDAQQVGACAPGVTEKGEAGTATSLIGSGAVGFSDGPWRSVHFSRVSGHKIETVEDVANTLAASARFSDRAELHGVALDREHRNIVCFTGNGEHSEANARLIAAAPALYEALAAWLLFAEAHFPEFDLEPCDSETLCPKCEPAGCITMKIERARAAIKLARGE